LIDVLDEHAPDLTRVRVHQMHTLHDHPYLHGAYGDHLRHVSYFLSSVTRSAFAEGGCDLVPVNFSELPLLLRRAAKRPIVLAAASPPDPHGYVSLGTNADYTARFIGQLPFFIEVNPQMPRTFGENSLHLSQVVGWTEADLSARRGSCAGDVGQGSPHRGARGRPRSAIQAGIGAIPNAILELAANDASYRSMPRLKSTCWANATPR
jgi:acyl-CoA hydrolase